MTWRNGLRIAAITLGGALVLSLFDIAQVYTRSLFISNYQWVRTAIDSVCTWLIVGSLAPFVILLASRLRVERPHLARRLPIHALAALTFAFTVIALSSLVIVMRSDIAFPKLFTKLAMFNVFYYSAMYAALVVAEHAIHYRRQMRAREHQLTRERLQVLRSRLNPHFLFNTLNAVSTMALQRDSEGVAQTLGLVGDLLRTALDDSLPQEIPLSRELEFTDKYIAIQRIRFGDRLQIERDIDPATQQALVPSMLLQPLVENAIVHGIAAVPGDGRLRIESRVAGGALQLTVSDSGNGFDPARMRDGIGLANTRERLETLYGDAQSLETRNDGGASVTITLPLRESAA